MPGFQDYKNVAKIVLFRVLDDKITDLAISRKLLICPGVVAVHLGCILSLTRI